MSRVQHLDCRPASQYARQYKMPKIAGRRVEAGTDLREGEFQRHPLRQSNLQVLALLSF